MGHRQAWVWASLLVACASGACSRGADLAAPTPRAPSGPAAPSPPEGITRRLTVLTYNVAGLPQWLSRVRPRQHLPRIGELMNGYDLVLAQEDFAYPAALRQHARFLQQTAGGRRRTLFNLGDGLSRFAAHPFTSVERIPWSTCHGHLRRGCDCLAPKGFSVATHEVTPGVFLDVYNVHLDAGKAERDVEARRAQTSQLLDYVRHHSEDRALLIAGDTNFRTDEDRRQTMQLLRDVGLEDACETLNCPAPRRIDRVFVRSSRRIRLTARKWRIDGRFVTPSGRRLSDHKAVAVTLEVRHKRQNHSASNP